MISITGSADAGSAGSPRTPTVSSRPATNCSTITASSYRPARPTAGQRPAASRPPGGAAGGLAAGDDLLDQRRVGVPEGEVDGGPQVGRVAHHGERHARPLLARL